MKPKGKIMKYFMIVWANRTDGFGKSADESLRKSIEDIAGKKPEIIPENKLYASIVSIGEKLELLTGFISNVVFLQTSSDEITANGITIWLRTILKQQRLFDECQWFVKEVSDPYPVS